MAFSVKLDVSALERLANKLDKLDPAAMGVVTRRAVNDAADSVYELARPRMIAGISLTDEYVKSRMQVTYAKDGGKAEAVITGNGAKRDMTQLVNYGAIQQMRPVNYGATRTLKGDAQRGIPIGMKSAGVSVSVTRGSNKLIEHGFLVKLNRGKELGGNGYGVATRSKGATGKKDYKIRYGPSVYQLFRYVASDILDEARDELENKVVEYATELFEKELR